MLDRKGKLGKTRADAWIILFSLTVSFWLYGPFWWLLLSFLAIRMLLISLLDYIYHYGSPLDDRLRGYNVSLPPLLSKFILHFNFHGIHHKNPGLPGMSFRACSPEPPRVTTGSISPAR